MTLGDDAINVIIPLIITARHSGIRSRFLFNPVLAEIDNTTGISMATMAEELRTDPIPPAISMISAISRVSLLPPSPTMK